MKKNPMYPGSFKAALFGIVWAGSLLASHAAFGAAPSSAYKLVFGDEFNGSTLDTMKWNYNYPWGNTHNHAAYMSPSQVKFTGSSLNLQAVNVRNPNAVDYYNNDFGWQVMDYTSGAINSSGKFNATYGYFEASIKQPNSLGSWPAFWMLQNGWPPEIDIMEYVHTNDVGANNTKYRTIANYHYTNASNANASYYKELWQGADLSAAYHTYGVEWTATQMKFYLDGSVIHTINDANAIADAAGMYMILNHGVGGWAGTARSNFPSDYLIDYVRVYQLPSSTSTTTTFSTTTSSGNWDTTTNWSVQVPKYEDVTAVFRNNSNATMPVTWTNSRAVGGLLLDSTTTAYTIGTSAGSLQFTSTGSTATIDVPSTNTQPHTVAARIDLYDTLTVTNNSGQTLTLSGKMTGPSGAIFEGTGVTIIANNNDYTGDTYIDNGTQGPAVVRVTRSTPFGTVGKIYFNPAGNSTSGRIEIQDTRTVPNDIVLSGRSPAAAAIVNLSATNTFSGKVSIAAGGGNYIFQSDSGLLQFTGAATQAGGIALTSIATGNRTVTFTGSGNGLVSGIINNGSATLGITKSGTGTWRLSGTNTYTGPTSITAGTLLVNGSNTNGGLISIASGATLGGTGTIDPGTGNNVNVAGILSPGEIGTIGTLTVGSDASPNNVVFSGGTLAIHLGLSNASDVLDIRGGLDLTAGNAKLKLYGDAGTFGGLAFPFLRFTPGTLGTARFAEIYFNDTLIPANSPTITLGYTLVYNNTDGVIALFNSSPVPEPAHLGALGTLAFLTLRRKH